MKRGHKVEETLDNESRVGCPFICFFTPSDIAYVLAIIKNGQDMWDQAKKPSTSPEKKLRPLLSAGEGRKRKSGISVWNKEGLEFYYTVEKTGERDTMTRQIFLC
jgi:hypothetical protein